MRKLLLLIAISPLLVCGQSLSPERIKKFRETVVRITIDSVNGMGTGFFIDKSGLVLTNWHVIQPAIVLNDKRLLAYVHKIFIQYTNGKMIEYRISRSLLKIPLIQFDAAAQDYCTLEPVRPVNESTPFFALARFDTFSEGEEVYTCGYPLAIKQQFISRGLLSTKYNDITKNFDIHGDSITVSQKRGLIDITMNGGNSGGPILKLGATIQEDKVVGIANFIIIPYSDDIEALLKKLLNIQKKAQGGGGGGGIALNGLDYNDTILLLTAALKSASNGLSGCISLDSYLDMVKTYKKN